MHFVSPGFDVRPLWWSANGNATGDDLCASAGDGALYDVSPGGEPGALRRAGLHDVRYGSALLCRRCADKFGGSRGSDPRLRHLWRRCIGKLRSGASALYVSQFRRPSGIC